MGRGPHPRTAAHGRWSMTAARARRILTVTAAALAGYALGRTTTAYGWTVPVVLGAITATAWCSGWLRSHALHSAVTAEANHGRADAERERDDACAIAVSIHEGATYQPLPNFIDRAEADRLNRHLTSIPCQHDPACGDVR